MSPTAATEPVFVESREGLAAAVSDIRGATVVAFDTEFVGEATYEPVLCLLQIATANAIYVIDPLAQLDLGEFWQALTAPDREVVALAARQEVLFCLRYAGRIPGMLFDPQLAAGLVGFPYPLSHTNLVQQVLGRRVAGGETTTDWRRRPLSAPQVAYAADDVRHLLEAREALLARAEKMGRTGWVRGECSRSVERVLEAEGEERWWRVSGANALDRRHLAVLRELWRWRERSARAANLPVRRILGDDLLAMIARRGPKNAPDLLALRNMDRPALRRAAGDIVAAVRKGLETKEADLPPLRRREDPPQLGILARLLSVLANGLAAEHQVDPALLATSADLEDFVRWRLAPEGEGQPALLDGWRGEILGHALVELLDGRMVVRVADATSPTPLRVEPV